MEAASEPGRSLVPRLKRVLLVAVPGRLEGIRRALERAGCCWSAMEDAGGILQAFGQAPPDLVVLDQATLCSRGPDLLEALIQVGPSVRLLVRDSGALQEMPPGLEPHVAGVLDEGRAPEVLEVLLGSREPHSAGRTRLLSGLGAATQVLETALDPKAIQEQMLDRLHQQLRLPCALLAVDPGEPEFTVRHERGLRPETSRLLRLKPDEAGLACRELLQVEAGQGTSELAVWCARAGHPRLAWAPIHGRGRFRGGFLVLGEGPGTFHPEDLALLVATSVQTGLLLDNLELQQVAWTRQRLVERLLERVIHAQEEERKWMASEIHDTLAQSLVGMHTMVQACRQLFEVDSARAGRLLDALSGLLSESLGEIRQILFNLRPASLDDLGLVPSLENYARRFLQGTGIQLILELPGRNQSRLPPLLETTVFRIAQEALSNIKKHSGAGQVRVNLDVGTTDVRLTVSDDGRGLVWSEVSERFQSGESYGLHGMRERSRLLGGSFRISNDPSGGTILEVVIPLAGPGPSSPEADLDLLLRQVLGGDGNAGPSAGS